jgi:1,4-dihydroxy-2-naphthoate octaprenyltransferase
MSLMKRVAPYVAIARGRFLLLPVTLVVAGAGAAAYEGAFHWGRTLLALAGLVLMHAAVNALNEAGDMATGIDLKTVPTPFSGGTKTLPRGLLSVRAARNFGYACVAVAALIGLWFALRLDPLFLVLLVAGAVSVLFYTPVFARSGVGELFAGLGLGLLPVWGAAWVQGLRPGPAALWAGVPAFFMTFNLLFLNEFPDEEADRSGGRRNLVLLMGRKRAALAYAAAGILTPLSIVAAVLLGAFPALALVAVLPSLFLVPPLAWAFGDTSKPVPIPAMGANVVWNLATNVVLGLALALAIAMR